MDRTSEKPYPDELPVIDPAWLVWDGGTVLNLARTIHKDRAWERIGILGDALEEAGLADPVILEHLKRPCCGCKGSGWWVPDGHQAIACPSCKGRGSHNTHDAGCWERQCWLVNHITGEPQPLVAHFRFMGSPDEVHKATAVNPGHARGRVWALYVEDCYDPPLYIVEASGPKEAEDIFIESEWGATERIDPADKFHNKDYGHMLSAGDRCSSGVMKKAGWVDLRGNVVDGERWEPDVTSDGTLYDGENIGILGDRHSNYLIVRCLYYGPGLPKHGVPAKVFWRHGTCPACGKVTYPDIKRPSSRNYCSLACYLKDYPEGKYEEYGCPVG